MKSIELAFDWWRSGGQFFYGVGEILPFVVIHGFAETKLTRPEPVMIGEESLHAKAFGITSIDDYVRLLDGKLSEMARAARECHIRAHELQEPQISTSIVYANQLGREICYERIAMPVVGPHQAPFVFTLSVLREVH